MNRVIWVDAEGMSFDNTVAHKLARLLDAAESGADLTDGMRVALKVNTSEEGYEYGLRPVFLRIPAEEARRVSNTRPTLCDGLRLVDYWRRVRGNTFMDVARAKGYSTDTLGGNFVINGGFSGDEGNLYSCGFAESVLGGVEVGTAVCRSDALWVLSHVTLHPLFGVSGALWNGGFECLSARARTRVLDGINPYPFNGARPPAEALRDFQRRALECALAVKVSVEGKALYVNYLWDVTPQPEYFPFSDKPAAPNLGFLASRDPVALDAATRDLLEDCGVDVEGGTGADFKAILQWAGEIGSGSSEYVLEKLS